MYVTSSHPHYLPELRLMTIDEAYNRLLITLSAVDDGVLCSCCGGSEGRDQLFPGVEVSPRHATALFHDDYHFVNNKHGINSKSRKLEMNDVSNSGYDDENDHNKEMCCFFMRIITAADVNDGVNENAHTYIGETCQIDSHSCSIFFIHLSQKHCSSPTTKSVVVLFLLNTIMITLPILLMLKENTLA